MNGNICLDQKILGEKENFIWGVHIDPSMEDTVVKLQISHNDFPNTWFNPDGSSITDNPDGTEVKNPDIGCNSYHFVFRLP